ncbi:MAG: glycosyltransferase involved in cell wall biosynthesis [Phycisphaerales bacterium]|jgi:glycosyltransferase involved in cell wall biosynthesis
MKIVHLIPELRLDFGGTVRAVIDLAAVHARHGHDVTVTSFDISDAPEDWEGVSTQTPAAVRLGPPGRGQRLSGAGKAELRGVLEGVDVVHLHSFWIPAVAQAASLAASMGIPVVVSAHGMLDDWSMQQSTIKKKIWLRVLGPKFFRSVSRYHTTAEEEKRQVRQWIPSSVAVDVSPYVIDIEPFQTQPEPGLAKAELGLDDSIPNVLFLSRLHYKKCPDVLIKAFGLLKQRGVRARLLLAGPGDEPYVRSLHAMADELELGEMCRFVGLVTGETKLSLYRFCDLFALPTSQENFGLVYTEAMACGTPALCTKGTDIWKELVGSGGAQVAERSPEAFADAIEALLSEPAKIEEMGRAGRAWVLSHFEPDRIGANFEGIYTRAISGEKTDG